MQKEYTDFLYLNEKDMINAGVKNMAECISTMEEVFSVMNNNDYRMGGSSGNDHGIKLTFPKETDIPDMPIDEPDRRFVAMPAYLGGNYKICGIKCYGSNQQNKQLGLPRSILMLSLLDSFTGMPIAYLSANILSAMRTGAVAGVGTKYLSKKKPKTIAIVGPGTMARSAISAFLVTQPTVESIRINGRGQKNISSFINYCKTNFLHIKEILVCDSIEDVCYNSDIIYFSTTNAAKFEDNPYLNGNWIKPGALVISTSALIMDADFLSDDNKCKLITDNYMMYEGWGKGKPYPTQKNVSTLIGMGFYDLVSQNIINRSNITDIGAIINRRERGRVNDQQIIIYAVGGMPTEDVAWGYRCYEKAKKKGIGTTLNLWSEPDMF